MLPSFENRSPMFTFLKEFQSRAKSRENKKDRLTHLAKFSRMSTLEMAKASRVILFKPGLEELRVD